VGDLASPADEGVDTQPCGQRSQVRIQWSAAGDVELEAVTALL
jgi:hypothetical protein